MADIKTTDVNMMCHVDESTIPESVEKVTIHLIKGGGVNLSNYYDKDDIDNMIGDIPTLRPTIELEVASLTTLTEAEKLAIKNTLNTLIVGDKIDGTKFDDIVLVTTTDLIRLHYSSIDYYVANPQITVIFETQSTKYILNVTVVDYTYSTLTSTATNIPTISTDIATDNASDIKTASPKAVKTFVEGKGYSTFSGSYTDLTDKPTIPTNTVTSTTITAMVKLTQAEYDLLTPDTNTFYIIVG